jgi:hypothetical protein
MHCMLYVMQVFWKSFDNNYNSKKSKLRVWAAVCQ